MNRTRKGLLFAVVALPLAVGACSAAPSNAHIELPQQYRLPQTNLLTTFERRSGRIAMLDENSNIVIMDQTGGGVVKITKDAAANSSSAATSGQVTNTTRSKIATGYHLPVWSPDSTQIAFIEVMAERISGMRIIEYGVSKVAVQRGSDSITIQQSDAGQSSERSPNTTSVLSDPSRVIIERNPSGNVLSSAIYTARTDGKSPLQEVYASNQYGIGYVDWSPDNSQIAFLAQTSSDEVALQLASTASTASANQVSGKPRLLATGTDAVWNWHPDGKSLVAKVDSTTTDNTADLSILDTQSDKTVATIIKKADIPFGSPAFSPDGNAMLVTVKSDGKDYLALADREGNVTRNLIQINGQVNFSWSPVTAKVAYIVQQDASTDSTATSSVSSGGALHLLDVNTGQDKVLSQTPVAAFFWSPDGARVAAFSPMKVSDITKDFAGMDLTPSQPSSVLMLQTIDVSSGAYRQLYYFEPTTEFQHLLNQFDRFSRSMNIWSPDSLRLVFPVAYNTSTSSNNYIIETEASGSVEFRVLGMGSLAVWSPK